MIWAYLALPACIIWIGILLLPWRPAGTREHFDVTAPERTPDLGDITVLIPARNESQAVAATLQALEAQGTGLTIVLIDDQSEDGTVAIAGSIPIRGLRIVPGGPLPAGWTGKLWALEQGRQYVQTPHTLLLDADIAIEPGVIAGLHAKMEREDIAFISLMASPRMQNVWEKLLMPAFVYFFRLLYPFSLSNNPNVPAVAGAAGGCILLETRVLDEIGGFGSLRDAVIDDCALARRVKSRGYRTWIGLSHSVRSQRAYDSLNAIWEMVARSAFTQLYYSGWLLACVTAVFTMAFWLPTVSLVFSRSTTAELLSAFALGAMMIGYAPTLRYYRRSLLWSLAMPLIGTLYLGMTWSSALRYRAGKRAYWKGRTYARSAGPGSTP